MDDWKFIKQVGLEIEGGWKDSRQDLVYDGSLRYDEFKNIDYDDYSVKRKIGELVTKPFSSLKEVLDFIDNNWPDESTERCGFHVHTSFHNIAIYSQLMEQVFFHFFLKTMEDWAKDRPCSNKFFWNRLNNGNKYCRKEFIPDKQINQRSKGEHRYTHLNYCYSFHKTVECRLFPVFESVETAKSATVAYLNCIESFLKQNPPQQDAIVDTMEFSENPSNELSEKIELIEDFKIQEINDKLILKPFNLFENSSGEKTTKYFSKVREKKQKSIIHGYKRINPYTNSSIPNFIISDDDFLTLTDIAT